MGARRLIATLVAAALALGACADHASPTPSPGTGAPAPTAGQPTGPPASAEASRFDPSAVSVSLQAFATVPGGPLAIAAPDDGSGRLFVAAQDGRAWVVGQDGLTRSVPLLDISGQITTGGERGLLGIAPHPGFADDPRVFVDYTDLAGNTVVASYRISSSDPNRLDPATAVPILHVQQPFTNHKGGALQFGPDGDLYVALGDGGSGGDPNGNGQSLATLLGKLLRIHVDVVHGDAPYSIPPDNPFVSRADAKGEIWAYGLRNPWRFSFDRQTGDLWIGDVGQGAWEEVDEAPAGTGGLDFGWNRMEGAHCYKPQSGCDQSGLTMPVAEYGHDRGCVVIGGYVYRGTRYPILQGGYVFLDYCSGRIWALNAATAAPGTTLAAPVQVGMTDGQVAAFGEDHNGELYVANLRGQVLRVVATRR